MEGYIKIESTYRGKDHGISIDTDLKDVHYMDRIVVLNGVCQALHITPTEMKLMAEFIESGVLEALTETECIVDKSEAPKPKKRPKVQVMSCAPEDLPDLLKELMGEGGENE